MIIQPKLFSLALIVAVSLLGPARAQTPIPAGDFDKLHKMILPQQGESRFQEIPWLLNVWEARTRAAREGKPLLVWAGAGGAPTAVC